MISLVLYALIAISLAAAAGYAFLNFTNTTKQVSYAQENAIRLDTAATALRSTLMAISPSNPGLLFAPVGISAGDSQGHTYMQLPLSADAVNASPWGQPFLYCPVSQTQASGLANAGTVVVKSPSTASYSVGTYTGPSTNNVSYVISNTSTNSVSNPGKFVAFIVSSEGPGKTIPDCSSIVVSGNTTTALHGSVRGIATDLPFKQKAAASNDRMEFYVSTTATGDGTGRDGNDLTTLDYAMNLWLALQPRQTNIFLAGGLVYSLQSGWSGSDLDAEAPSGTITYPLAQGQNTSLMIGTVPGASSLATLSLIRPIVLTSATSFINLNLEAASTLTTLKPLVFKNLSYAATQSGTSFNIIDTNFSVQNVNFTNTYLVATNSTVEFYNWGTGTSSSFSNSQLFGSLSQFSFDGQGTTTYSFTNNITNNAPLSLSLSSTNIAQNATVSITNSTDSVLLTNSTLTVPGTLALSGGATLAAIDVLSGSTLSIPVNKTGIPASGTISVTQSIGALPYGIFVRGSKVGIDGTFSTTGLSGGAINISEGELTGASTGTIIDAQPSVYPCIYLTNGANGNSVPIYITDPSAYSGYPIFTTVQLGYQPMVGDTTNSVQLFSQRNAAATLVANNANPLVYNDTSLAAITTATPRIIGYVDPSTMENAVRDLVDLESVTGINLNFYGTCQA